MRRYGIGLSCVLSLVVLVGQVAAQEQDFSQIEVKGSKVDGNIYMLQADPGSGNIGASVGPDGILIVDDQFAPLADKIRAALKDAGGGSLKFVLNTHWHFDHTGGNKVFGPEAPIIAHTNVRKRLMTETTVMGRTIPADPKEAWPVITFDSSLSVHFNGEEIKVVHFPHGHTDGDSVIFFTGSNVVHMGDHYFANWFPFVDLENGGDVEGYANNVGAVIKQLPADVKIIPGHGPLSTLTDLQAYHRMLVQTIAVVQKGIAAGKSLEASKADGLPEEWNAFATGPISEEAWVETIYRSLIRKSKKQ
ncbi:MAG: MBL fold metallo-hydrolase [Candidatus Binatia bacterium]